MSKQEILRILQKPQKLQAILDHPRIALVLALIAIGLTLSGKLSVAAARICFLLAWISATLSFCGYRPTRSRPWLLALLAIGTGIVLFGLGAWALPEAVPRSFGSITPRRTLLFGKGVKGPPKLEIGDSTAVLVWGGPSGTPFLQLAKDSDLTIENIRGRIFISTQVRDRFGQLVAEINRNDWRVSSAAWDRNYNNDSFEVKDGRGKVVLQVRALPDRIQLQGEWRDEKGDGVRIVKSNDQREAGGLIIPLKRGIENDIPPIEPLFEYPSESHLGELRKK